MSEQTKVGGGEGWTGRAIDLTERAIVAERSADRGARASLS